MIYFAYGSNMDAGQMRSRCPRASVIGVGKVSHYGLFFTRWSHSWDSATADILPERNKEVYGVLYDLPQEDLKRMDQFADYPRSYIRQDVGVDFQGAILPALTYVAMRQGVFLPSKTYLERMIVGAEGYHLPDHYIAFLRAIQTQDERQKNI